jgi:hypothetical protein
VTHAVNALEEQPVPFLRRAIILAQAVDLLGGDGFDAAVIGHVQEIRLDHAMVAARLEDRCALAERLGETLRPIVRGQADRVGIHVAVTLYVHVECTELVQHTHRTADSIPLQDREQVAVVAGHAFRCRDRGTVCAQLCAAADGLVGYQGDCRGG